MAANMRRSAAPLITTIQKLFSEDLAKERMTFSYPISRAAARRAGGKMAVRTDSMPCLMSEDEGPTLFLRDLNALVFAEPLALSCRREARVQWAVLNSAH